MLPGMKHRIKIWPPKAFASQDSEFPNRQTALCRSKRCRRERNFWTQRPEAKNPPERPLLSAETGNSKIGVKNPRRNGLFPIGDGFRSSGRLDGGVRSQIRIGLHLQFPANREINREFCDSGPSETNFVARSHCA